MSDATDNHTEEFYPKGESFAQLLKWHLEFGTRPRGSPKRSSPRWTVKEFAFAVGPRDERTIRNWCSGKSKPTDLQSVEREFFGENSEFDRWRMQLREAYDGISGGADSANHAKRVRQVAGNGGCWSGPLGGA